MRETAPIPDHPADVVDEDTLTIYVDGSMYSTPRRGGIGIVFVWLKEDGTKATYEEWFPSTPGATNNQMELEAPRQALELAMGKRAPFTLRSFNKIVMRTDSEYVYENVSHAVYDWPKTGWTKSGGAAVSNIDDWKELVSVLVQLDRKHRLRVHWEWIKGKKGEHAKAVDRLAKKSSNSASFGRGRPTLVRRKFTTKKVQIGSVKVSGQILAVHVISATPLGGPHRGWRYKYEVTETIDSPYVGNVDQAESEHNIDPGHTYLVLMNDAQSNPRIEDVLEEIEEDLTPFIDALQRIGRPATVPEVAEELLRAGRRDMSEAAVGRRLMRLVEGEQVTRRRSSGPGRPYVYEVAASEVVRPTAAT